MLKFKSHIVKEENPPPGDKSPMLIVDTIGDPFYVYETSDYASCMYSDHRPTQQPMMVFAAFERVIASIRSLPLSVNRNA